jgi:uncharacterized protein YqgC (DUF456 family)
MDWTIFLWLLAALIVVAGLAGTVVPALPGVPLIFAGLFLGAWIGDFETVGWVSIGVLGALAALAWIIDAIAGAAGARYVGAGPRAFWGATIGAIVGMFFGLAGMLIGPFVGAVIGELSGGSDLVRSGRAGVGTWLGMVVATAIKLAIAFLMIGIFLFRLGVAWFDEAEEGSASAVSQLTPERAAHDTQLVARIQPPDVGLDRAQREAGLLRIVDPHVHDHGPAGLHQFQCLLDTDVDRMV